MTVNENDVLVLDLFEKILESIATVHECEDYIEKLTEHKIEFCTQDLSLHVFKGIDSLAEMLEIEPETNVFAKGEDEFNPYERRFEYEGFDIYQLSERNGEFR